MGTFYHLALKFIYNEYSLKIDESTYIISIRNEWRCNMCYIGDWINENETQTRTLTVKMNKMPTSYVSVGIVPFSNDIHINKEVHHCCNWTYAYTSGGGGKIWFNKKQHKVINCPCNDGDVIKLSYSCSSQSLIIKI